MDTPGQRHDRIGGHGNASGPGESDGSTLHLTAPPTTTPTPTTTSEVDTSVTQKMLSAVSGSILTSLLSMFSLPNHSRTNILTPHSDTSGCSSYSPPIPTESVPVPLPPLAHLCPAASQSGCHGLLSRGLLGAEPVPVLRRCAFPRGCH